MQRLIKNLGLYLILMITVISIVNAFLSPGYDSMGTQEISYSQFLQYAEEGKIKDVTFDELQAKGKLTDGKAFVANITGEGELAREIASKGIDVNVAPPVKTPWWTTFLASMLPTLLLIGVWIFFMNQMQGGGGKVMNFAKSKAKMFLDNRPKVTFDDVAGCDESKEELQEVVEYLKDSSRFTKLGAKVPKGVLLLGPPGTGKTLLARACAGEANVPFFSTSGSDFVEMFVGVGASRVRDLFDQARKAQPCIVFIDEIDAVGRQRGAGLGGGHDEREQTLNQLLVEMDGFDEKTDIILIAATNRADVLDPALLRPGRFDRHIVVDRPDLQGRKAIFKVHAKGKNLAPDVDLEVLAKRTPGFVGADIANVINEAALLASRAGKKEITMKEFEEGIDRAIAGTERRSRILSAKEREIVAYHETGHALVAKLIPGADPVHKISIIPRGSAALGYTMQLPKEDRFLASKSELMTTICVLLSGRAIEDIVFQDVTTGAGNDLERATKIARQMVTQFGMSDLGLVTLGKQRHEVFLGRDLGEDRDYSDQVAYAIDQEVNSIIQSSYDKVKGMLNDNIEMVHKVAKTLLEKEAIDGRELAILMGEDPDEYEIKCEDNCAQVEEIHREFEEDLGNADNDEAAPVGISEGAQEEYAGQTAESVENAENLEKTEV